MAAPNENDRKTVVARGSDRELVVTRTFNGPVHIVFEAWATPALFQRWWVPRSSGMTMLSCEMDIRTGGSYRLVFQHPAMPQPMAFFGRYKEVVPNTRMVWTNDENGEGNGAVTTVTFEEIGGRTLVIVHELYPSKEALDAVIAGMEGGMSESFEQLEELLVTLVASVPR